MHYSMHSQNSCTMFGMVCVCSLPGGYRPVSTLRGIHHWRGSSSVERHSASTLEAVRVPWDVEGRVRRGSAVRDHHTGIHRTVLCRDSPDVRHDPLRQGRGAQLPRSFLYHRDNLHGLVYRGGDSAVRLMPRKAAVLEGLQERGRCDGNRSILRDTLQRSVDNELLQC